MPCGPGPVAIGRGSWWAPFASFGANARSAAFDAPAWQEVWTETTTALGTHRQFMGYLWASARQVNDLWRNLGLSQTASGARDIRICPAGQPKGVGCLTGSPNLVLSRRML